MSDQVVTLPDGRMTVEEAAKYLGFTPLTLALWRRKGTGPKFVKLSRRVFYFKADLDEWIASHKAA